MFKYMRIFMKQSDLRGGGGGDSAAVKQKRQTLFNQVLCSKAHYNRDSL